MNLGRSIDFSLCDFSDTGITGHRLKSMLLEVYATPQDLLFLLLFDRLAEIDLKKLILFLAV